MQRSFKMHKSVSVIHHINTVKNKSLMIFWIDVAKTFDKTQHPFTTDRVQGKDMWDSEEMVMLNNFGCLRYIVRQLKRKKVTYYVIAASIHIYLWVKILLFRNSSEHFFLVIKTGLLLGESVVGTSILATNIEVWDKLYICGIITRSK